MAPKDLVVFLETGQGVSERLAYAAALAKRWQAHLIATFVTQPLAVDAHLKLTRAARLKLTHPL